MTSNDHRIRDYLTEASRVLDKTRDLSHVISDAADLAINALKSGKKVMWCGNGGSAADSQHLAAELVGRYKVNRRALNSIALTTDTSVITALANDFGYDAVFSRQVEALGLPGDVLVAISTSGKSSSILAAIKSASANRIGTIFLTSSQAPEIEADIVIRVDSGTTEHIQQAHMAIGHVICELIEEALCG